MQTPKVGLMLNYHPERTVPQIWAAMIIKVIDNNRVNVDVTSDDGIHFPKFGIVLYQGEGERPKGDYVEWPENDVEELMSGT